MKIKQTIVTKILPVVALLTIASVFFGGSTAYAYTCDKSGDNGGNTWRGHKIQSDGKGSCVYIEPDHIDDNSRNFTPDPKAPGGGTYSCTNGTVLHDDGHCWAYRTHYTNAKPTYDDGTEVPEAVWADMCSDIQEGTFQPGHHYSASRHRCESANGCIGMDDDSIKEGNTYGNPASVGECRQLGSGSDIPADPTTQTPADPSVVDKCKDRGGVDPKDNTKCADGTNPDEAAAPKGPEIKQVEGRCGEARVNIIVCGEKGGNEALTNVLKIALRVLTVLVGVAAVGGLSWAAVNYARAADDSGVVSDAKKLMRNVIIGILLYGFLAAIVNWLIPGGIFG